jgi:hypothetical protein
VKEDNFENGAFLGKFELSSTAITWLPAPIAKRISVALGDRETIRCGRWTAGAVDAAACEVVEKENEVAATIAKISSGDDPANLVFPVRKERNKRDESVGIKKLPRDVREEMVGNLTPAKLPIPRFL